MQPRLAGLLVAVGLAGVVAAVVVVVAAEVVGVVVAAEAAALVVVAASAGGSAALVLHPAAVVLPGLLGAVSAPVVAVAPVEVERYQPDVRRGSTVA